MSQRKKSKHEQKKKTASISLASQTDRSETYLSIYPVGGGVIDLITAPGQRYQRHGNQALPEGKLSNTVIIT